MTWLMWTPCLATSQVGVVWPAAGMLRLGCVPVGDAAALRCLVERQVLTAGVPSKCQPLPAAVHRSACRLRC